MFVPPILHADLDAFFASVEQRDDPALRGRPVVVGGGVVMAASYEARAHGVRSGMGGSKWRRLCPDAAVVRPRFDAYVEAGNAVVEIFRRISPLVERASIDEAFLDIGGLGPPRDVAVEVRRAVRAEVGLPVSVGVASTKVLAKIAGANAKPDGLAVLAPDEELPFLHGLPVERLWGVGARTTAKLHAHGLRTAGDMARAGEATLIALLGRGGGRHLHAVAHNLVASPVQPRHQRRSFGAQRALGRDGASRDLDDVLVRLIDRLTKRMARSGHLGRTVTLRLRFGDFERATRSRTLPQATAEREPFLAAATALLDAARPSITRRGLTLLGLSIGNLEHYDGVQLTLALDEFDYGADVGTTGSSSRAEPSRTVLSAGTLPSIVAGAPPM